MFRREPWRLYYSSKADDCSGLMAVYKPQGWTSSDVVQKIRSILERDGSPAGTNKKKRKIKVGHGGTLDPLARGVLVLGVGGGTKLMQEYLLGTKVYYGIGQLGTSTDTLDSEGTTVSTMDCSHVDMSMLQGTLSSFCGNILQRPPMYSALKKDGVRMYDLARSGVVVPREPRPVTVDNIVLDNSVQLPKFGIRVECGGGVYIRALISDIAEACSSCAHMTALERLKHGPFELEDCLHEDMWNAKNIKEHIAYCSNKVGIS